MKRLLTILAFLLLAAPALACDVLNTFDGACYDHQPVQLARMNPAILGSGVIAVACGTIGDETDYGSEHTDMGSLMICCQLFTPECSGTLGYGYVQHYGTATDNGKILVYQDNGSSANNPDSTDAFLVSSSSFTTSADEQVKTSEKLGGSVSSASKYWVCILADTTGFDVVRTATSANKLYYTSISNFGTLAPINSYLGWMSEAASRSISLYVDVE